MHLSKNLSGMIFCVCLHVFPTSCCELINDMGVFLISLKVAWSKGSELLMRASATQCISSHAIGVLLTSFFPEIKSDKFARLMFAILSFLV